MAARHLVAAPLPLKRQPKARHRQAQALASRRGLADTTTSARPVMGRAISRQGEFKVAQIPQPRHTTINAINRAHEQRHAEEKPRGHMGVSQLGKPDERELWLSFRHAFQPFIEGRVLRLFRRGHREEDTVVADLIAAGMDVRDTGKNQRTLRFGSHVAGSCDGVIMAGVPEAPSKPHVMEAKTISKSRFAQLQKNGLEKSNWTYWVQVACYMHGTGIDRCLFIAVCKDDDSLYVERVKYDKALAEKYIERGQRIALSDRMPEPLTSDPTAWRMNFSNEYAPA